MINLLPQHARRNVILEYWFRVGEVWLLLLGSALLIITVLNLPVYVLLSNQKHAYSQQAEEAQALSLDLDSSQAIITKTNAVARLLAQQDHQVPFTDYITQLESLKSPSITINEVFLLRDDSKAVSSIQLTGLAATRQSLADYRRAVENDPLFSTVELPISNLAKDEDILFNVKIIPANLTDV